MLCCWAYAYVWCWARPLLKLQSLAVRWQALLHHAYRIWGVAAGLCRPLAAAELRVLMQLPPPPPTARLFAIAWKALLPASMESTTVLLLASQESAASASLTRLALPLTAASKLLIVNYYLLSNFFARNGLIMFFSFFLLCRRVKWSASWTSSFMPQDIII